MRNITQINIPAVSVHKMKRVAAYARVSSGKDAMLRSLSAQISYYSEMIQKHKDWEYSGIYADEALTGTKENRPQFIRLLNDCRQGKVDMVITKSISRFARNTVTLLTAVRELKEYGIDVYFEEQNIHTMSGDGELMLTILASYAQEESLSVSENCKWRIRNKYKEGIPNTFSVFGYRVSGKKLQINVQEAQIVRIIFDEYISGLGKLAIAKKLNANGIRTKNNREWNSDKVREILRNEKYAGDILLQKAFISNHLDKKTCKNDGALPKYYISNNHEAIVDRETFDAVQDEMDKRGKNYKAKPTNNTYPFTGKIICSNCGKSYHRKNNNAGTKYQKIIWICSTYNTMGKSHCDAKQIPESVLEELSTEFDKEIQQIIALENKRLKFIFLDNTEVVKEWNY